MTLISEKKLLLHPKKFIHLDKMAKTNYESVVILTPVLSEKMLQDAANSFEKLITENGGELIHKENWGLTKMAYTIQNKTTGFYQIFEFAAEADAEIVDKLELAYRSFDSGGLVSYASRSRTANIFWCVLMVCGHCVTMRPLGAR